MSAAVKAQAVEDHVNAVDVAHQLVANRRAALNMSVDQIRQLAAAVLIIDQQLDDANRRMASMMLAEPTSRAKAPKPARTEFIRTPVIMGDDPALCEALNKLVEAHWQLNQERHSTGENPARQKFERAAIAVCNHVSPKQRT